MVLSSVFDPKLDLFGDDFWKVGWRVIIRPGFWTGVLKEGNIYKKRPQAGLFGVSDRDQNGGSRDGISASGTHGGGRRPSGLPRCNSWPQPAKKSGIIDGRRIFYWRLCAPNVHTTHAPHPPRGRKGKFHSRLKGARTRRSDIFFLIKAGKLTSRGFKFSEQLINYKLINTFSLVFCLYLFSFWYYCLVLLSSGKSWLVLEIKIRECDQILTKFINYNVN